MARHYIIRPPPQPLPPQPQRHLFSGHLHFRPLMVPNRLFHCGLQALTVWSPEAQGSLCPARLFLTFGRRPSLDHWALFDYGLVWFHWLPLWLVQGRPSEDQGFLWSHSLPEQPSATHRPTVILSLAISGSAVPTMSCDIWWWSHKLRCEDAVPTHSNWQCLMTAFGRCRSRSKG